MQRHEYKNLLVEDKGKGIALVTINRPDSANATDADLHRDLGDIWIDLDRDPYVKVIVITGAGNAFCAGGELSLVQRMMDEREILYRTYEEARHIVLNMINTPKPIISAINGAAVGAGAAVALMADISIASKKARLNDGHSRLGVAAGDHACAIWPLLCGMAKAKYYLLTNDFLDAQEAERIGLISMAVKHEELMEKAMAVATKLAEGPTHALRYTKRALNTWLNKDAFELSCALEMLSFGDKDAQEGLQAIKERRKPRFPSAAKL